MSKGLKDIQDNISRIEAHSIAAGEKLLDVSAKSAVKIAENLSKTIEELQKHGVEIAINVTDTVVETSKRLSEAVDRVMDDSSSAAVSANQI